MLFDWLRRRRREHILEAPFPAAWHAILERNLGCFRELDEAEQTHLCQLVQVFIAEKHWEGAGGLALDDEIRVTVAGQACLLILGLDHDLYRQVESIIVYPSTVVAPPPPTSFGAVLTAPPRGRVAPDCGWPARDAGATGCAASAACGSCRADEPDRGFEVRRGRVDRHRLEAAERTSAERFFRRH